MVRERMPDTVASRSRANLIPIFVDLHAAAVKMEDGNRRGGMGI